jgi:AraC-like DNA-binding protein
MKVGGVNHHENMVFTIRFVNAILVTAMEARVNLEEIYPRGIRKLYSELLDAFEPARTRRYIKMHLIDPILEARGELLNQKSYSMLEDIEKMIAESKGDITLNQCADALQVHPTYIWKILKMDKGRSFSDYLEEYKLEEAKRLLLHTSMTVAEIAAELNYTNAQNFIRFFSKSMGITPGKFRKLNE